jgi:hypothetical protein
LVCGPYFKQNHNNLKLEFSAKYRKVPLVKQGRNSK